MPYRTPVPIHLPPLRPLNREERRLLLIAKRHATPKPGPRGPRRRLSAAQRQRLAPRALRPGEILTLAEVRHRLRALIHSEDSVGDAAHRLRVTGAHLYMLLRNGRAPGPKVLAGLGLKRVITYVAISRG